MATKEIRLQHPDHADRADDGIYVTDDPVEAMSLQTRGYTLLSGDVADAPARTGGAKSGGAKSTSSASDSGGSSS